MKKRTSDLLALLLAILVGFGNVYNIFLSFLATPQGTEYLGISNFFLPDYLFYLTFIKEGMRGLWRIVILYTQEETVYWVIHWPYLLIGHLSRLFSLSAPVGYWPSVFFLSGAIVLCAYLFLRLFFKSIGKSHLVFPVLLAYLFTGSFFLIQKDPFSIRIMDVTWYYRADLFTRLGIIPHHLIANLGVMIFFIASFYLFESFKKKKYTFRSFLFWLAIAFLLFLVMSIAPIEVTYLLPAFGAALVYSLFFYRFFKPKGILFNGISFEVLVLGLFLFGLYFQKNIASFYNEEVGIAEISNHMAWPTLKNFFFASGPVLILAIPALLILCRNVIKAFIHPSLFMGVTASILSYALFSTKISLLFNTHNSRFLFPDAYLFMAMVVFLALDELKAKSWKKKAVIWLTTILIIGFSVPANYFILKLRGEKRTSFTEEYYEYLPDDLVDGLKFLENESLKNPLVLTTVVSGLRMFLPIYTQARVYATNYAHTINFPQKAKNCNDFFTNVMSDQQKIDFLRREKINYLVFSIYDLGDLDKKFLHEPYFISPNLPLKLIFSNSKVVIYKVI